MITQMIQKNRDTQMNHDDNFPHKEVTYNIIGIAMRIHRELGSGFLEAVYEEALIAELNENNISYRNQIPLEIHYKSTRLKKKYRADFIIDGKVLVEIKKTKSLTKIDEMQMINYLKASNLKVGLLLNFALASLQWKRIIY